MLKEGSSLGAPLFWWRHKAGDWRVHVLKMSQYDPQTDAYRKKPLKERWHRWENTGTLVQRDAMSAFLTCHATEKGHDRALLLEKWTTAEALLSGSGLCVRTVTFRRLCPLKELSDGQSESSVFRQGSFKNLALPQALGYHRSDHQCSGDTTLMPARP